MLSTEALKELMREIMKQGFDPETASDFAVRISHTPRIDVDGSVIVTDDHGREMARLKPLQIFNSANPLPAPDPRMRA
jgi:hypothetical protein